MNILASKTMTENIPLGTNSPATVVHRVKVVVVGSSSVGKTAIALQYTKGQFEPTHRSTLAASFLQRSVLVNNVEVQLQIWDTAGQEKYMALIPMYLRGANVALIVFDVTDDKSFEDVEKWLRMLETYTECYHKVLVANKSDLQATVSMLRAEIFAAEHEMDFIQTSAKTGLNIDKLFLSIALVVIDKIKLESSIESRDKDALTSSTVAYYHLSPKKKTKCCRH